MERALLCSVERWLVTAEANGFPGFGGRVLSSQTFYVVVASGKGLLKRQRMHDSEHRACSMQKRRYDGIQSIIG